MNGLGSALLVLHFILSFSELISFKLDQHLLDVVLPLRPRLSMPRVEISARQFNIGLLRCTSIINYLVGILTKNLLHSIFLDFLLHLLAFRNCQRLHTSRNHNFVLQSIDLKLS